MDNCKKKIPGTGIFIFLALGVEKKGKQEWKRTE